MVQLPAESNEPKDEETPSVQELQKELEEVAKRREQSERKAAEYLDQLKRLQADMENLRRITNRQIDTVTKQASEKLLVKLLPILDALEQAGNIAESGNSLPPDEIAVGLKMLRQQLAEILAAEGLEEIPTVGQPLDTARHEVVSYLETDEKQENTIMEEIRKGYTLNGKVVRPSLVVVSKLKGRKEPGEEEDE